MFLLFGKYEPCKCVDKNRRLGMCDLTSAWTFKSSNSIQFNHNKIINVNNLIYFYMIVVVEAVNEGLANQLTNILLNIVEN